MKKILDIQPEDYFYLSDNFIDKYKRKQPKWGFDGLGYIVYKRTYARPILNKDGKPTNKSEEFWQTCKRVVETCYTLQRWHCRQSGLPWNAMKAQYSAQTMYDLMWNFKFLPPGRGLWGMHLPLLESKGSGVLYNCATCSTRDINQDFADPFCFLMDFSMLGVGVSGDTRGAGKLVIKKPKQDNEVYVVEDTREGWVKLIRRIINSYAGKDALSVDIDYSQIRQEGERIFTMGGVAPGSEPLKHLVKGIHETLGPLIDKPITSSAIADLFNRIGVCVVSGNLRRTAILLLGDVDDDEFINLKNPKKYAKELNDFRGTSNNSVIVDKYTDFSKISQHIIENGEPGCLFLDNARRYGRMKDGSGTKDAHVINVNPCQPGSATVLTPEGIRKFDDIDKNSVIWSGHSWTKVVDKWKTGEKEVYRYRTTFGEFEGTSNHKVLISGVRTEVGQVKHIDWVVGPMLTIKIDTQDVMDGLVIGDGSVHAASNNLVHLHIGKNDSDYFDSEIKHLISRHRPGLKDTAFEITTTVDWTELPKTYERFIPNRFYYGELRKVAGFLRGLFSANGSVVQNGRRITLKQSSKHMILQVQKMLSAIGIPAYITVNKPTDVKFRNGIYRCKRSYDLNITSGKTRFIESVGFLQSYKNDKIGQSGKPKVLKAEIKEVIFVGIEDVYDITVEDKSHTYWTGGCLVSNCGEITLENKELCNIPETFPSLHDSYEEYEKTLKFAYLYGKTVSFVPTHDSRTNAVMMKNHRIGCSQSGIIESFIKHGRRTHFEWCKKGYQYLRKLDDKYSDWLCIPKSKKITSVKPSGSVSLLSGVTSGIHYPPSQFYYKTMRIAKNTPLLESLKLAGYKVENLKTDLLKKTAVVYFPVKVKNFSKAENDVSIWEQLENVAQMQYYWSDNSVSATIKINSETEEDIANALELYAPRLKSISFLPYSNHHYDQAPWIPISENEYNKVMAKIESVKIKENVHDQDEKFCDGDACELK